MTAAISNLRQSFIEAMSYAASTVNVVTTDGAAGRAGVTVSAMSSVSADTQNPTMLVCVNQRSAAAQVIIDNGAFCVNVLRDDQSFIADCFAGRFLPDDGDKFSCTEWSMQSSGIPRVRDALVSFDCRLQSIQLVGMHYVLFGSVKDVYLSGRGSPLLYANRTYSAAARIHVGSSKATEATECLRVGTLSNFGPCFVPGVVRLMAARGKLPDIYLVEGDERTILEELRLGVIDLALIYERDLGEEFKLERLADLAPYVILPPDHRLSDQTDVSLAELSTEPLILYDRSSSGEYFTGLFKDCGMTPTIGYRVNSFEMVRGMVGQGLGYSILVTRPASDVSYDGRSLEVRPLRETTNLRHLAVASKIDRPGLTLRDAFIDACRQSIEIAGLSRT